MHLLLEHEAPLERRRPIRDAVNNKVRGRRVSGCRAGCMRGHKPLVGRWICNRRTALPVTDRTFRANAGIRNPTPRQAGTVSRSRVAGHIRGFRNLARGAYRALCKTTENQEIVLPVVSKFRLNGKWGRGFTARSSAGRHGVSSLRHGTCVLPVHRRASPDAFRFHRG